MDFSKLKIQQTRMEDIKNVVENGDATSGILLYTLVRAKEPSPLAINSRNHMIDCFYSLLGFQEQSSLLVRGSVHVRK